MTIKTPFGSVDGNQGKEAKHEIVAMIVTFMLFFAMLVV